jgi:transposase
VSIDLDALPEDNTALQQMLRDVVGTVAQRDAQLNELTAENEKLQSLIVRLLRHRFGRRSEKLTPEQLLLAVADLEQEAAECAAEAEAKAPEKTKARRSKPPQRNLGALPAHLPRYEVVLDIDSKACPCCSGELHQIGETTTEMLDLVPAQLRVKVLRRPRYGLWIPIQGGQVFQPDGGHPTDLMAATLPI